MKRILLDPEKIKRRIAFLTKEIQRLKFQLQVVLAALEKGYVLPTEDDFRSDRGHKE